MIFLPTVYVIILAVILQLEFCSSSASQDNNLKNKYEVIKQSNGPFCDSFLKAVSSSKNENVLISPLSLHYALSALFLGSFGQTRTELRKILHLPNNENVIKAAFKEFTGLLKVNKNVKIGTTFFLDEEFPIVDSFQNDLRSNFDASVETLDFKNRSEDSRLMINNFVKNKTNNLIHDLFGKGSITENTVSVLVNTIHFKAQWIHPFARTSKKNFHGFDGNNKIDMMYISDVKLRYKNDDELNAQLLEVPYEMGLNTIFSDKADFSKLSSVPVKVSNVVQKTFINIDENSTEAGVATGVDLSFRMGRLERNIIKADHPFLYAIVHESTDTPLFVGKFIKP
ncbi:serpin B11-like isoform X3 [Lycorma delicatula]|uniref:serpin B11-like isoform X3 n=1 Tax=Lycorma delicatula TaxID=130591 RepID=UPI003F50F5DA